MSLSHIGIQLINADSLNYGSILIIDKPAGMSHDVVARVRRILRTKVLATRDARPFATGVMVVLVGKATRLAQFDKDEKSMRRM